MPRALSRHLHDLLLPQPLHRSHHRGSSWARYRYKNFFKTRHRRLHGLDPLFTFGIRSNCRFTFIGHPPIISKANIRDNTSGRVYPPFWKQTGDTSRADSHYCAGTAGAILPAVWVHSRWRLGSWIWRRGLERFGAGI